MFKKTYKSELFYHQCQERLNSILESPQQMYHYTNIEALKSIIEGRCMYATHINFMNDWEEYEMGYQVLTNKIKVAIENYRKDFEDKIGVANLAEIEKYFCNECLNVTTYSMIEQRSKFREFRACTIPEVYTISFCKEKDLLSQWAIYAKETGVAIEFDFSNFVFTDATLAEKDEEYYKEDDWQEIKYYRYNKPHTINYSNQEMDEMLHDQITEVVRLIKDPDFAKDELIRRPVLLVRKMTELYSIVPYCKLDKFKAESEIRVAFMRIEDWLKCENNKQEGIHKTKVFYRTANHVLKPFLRIGWEAMIPNEYPIKKIIIGPGKNQEVVFRGLIHFIENQDNSIIPNKDIPFTKPMVNGSYLTCKGITIQKSNIPYIF